MIDGLLGPHVSRTTLVDDIALETPFEGPVVEAMVKSLLEHDPALSLNLIKGLTERLRAAGEHHRQ